MIAVPKTAPPTRAYPEMVSLMTGAYQDMMGKARNLRDQANDLSTQMEKIFNAITQPPQGPSTGPGVTTSKPPPPTAPLHATGKAIVIGKNYSCKTQTGAKLGVTVTAVTSNLLVDAKSITGGPTMSLAAKDCSPIAVGGRRRTRRRGSSRKAGRR